MKYPHLRFLRESADGDKGGGASTPDPRDAEIAALRAKADAFEKSEKERTEILAAKERDKIAKDAEAAKGALEAKDKELSALRAKAEAYEKAEQVRFESIYNTLAEDTRERLSKYKDGMPVETWRRMVEDEALISKDKTEAPLVFGSSGQRPESGFKISAQAKEILDNIPGEHDSVLKVMGRQVVKEKNGMSHEVLGVPMKKFIEVLSVQRGRNLNKIDAEKRKGV